MNKKFLSAILFGALAIASTGSFVSCKDYDDDIDNLQTQINGLASAKDLSDKVSALQSAISSAQTAAEAKAAAAQAVADAAKTAAEKAGADAKAANDAAAAAADAAAKALDAAVEVLTKDINDVKGAQAAAEEACKKALDELQAAVDKAATKDELKAAEAAVAAVAEGLEKNINDVKVSVEELAKTVAEKADKKDLEAVKKDLAAAKEEALAAAAEAKAAAVKVGEDAAAALKASEAKLNEAVAAADAAAKKAQETADKANAAVAELAKTAATKEELAAVAAAAQKAQDAADAAKEDAAAAAAAAQKAQQTADKNAAALVAQAKAIEAKADAEAVARLDTRVTALEAALEKLAGEDGVAALAKLAEGLGEDLKGLTEDVKVMVTEVSLIDAFLGVYDADYSHVSQGTNLNFPIGGSQGSNPGLDLGFKSVTEQTTKFGPKGELVFDATKSHSLQTSNVVVRVNPANATITKEDVKLINSKGESLDEYLEIGEPTPFKSVITRATVNTGLWVIPVSTKENVTMETLAKATTVKCEDDDLHSICYAVAIGNEERSVVSSFDVTAAPKPYYPIPYLEFEAKDKDAAWNRVEVLHNRYSYAEDATVTEKDEYTWYNAEPESVIPATAENIVKETNEAKKLYQNVTNRDADQAPWEDDRQDKDFLAVEVNKPIDIRILWDDENNKFFDIKAFYVAYDTINAVESAPSEWNAWESYEVENLNKVIMGNEGSITIKSPSANGDIIGFRVYAVNLDGTLLDPDGRAFYVYVGDATKLGTVPTQPILATKADGSETTTDFLADFQAALADIKNAAYEVEGWTNTKAPQFTNEDGDPITEPVGDDSYIFDVMVSLDGTSYEAVDETNINIIDFAKVKKVKYEMPTATDFVDGGTYEQQMKIYKKVGDTKVLVKTITVSFTKVMPSEAPKVKYITGQNSQLLLAPIANPTILAEFGGAAVADQAAINLNNVYYELSRDADGSIKLVADNSVWNDEDGKKAYVDPFDVKNAATATDLIIDNSDYAAFTAITNGSAHTFKFYGYYVNVSYAYDADLDDMHAGDFTTKESKDFNVTYNCWDKFTTWKFDAFKYEKLENGEYTFNATPANNTMTFKPELQWTTAGDPITWPGIAVKATNKKNPEIFNTTLDKYFAASVIAVEDEEKDIFLEDVEDPEQINNYFTPSVDAATGKIKFVKSQYSVNPEKDVKQILKIKATDVFGHEIILTLGEVTILQQK